MSMPRSQTNWRSSAAEIAEWSHAAEAMYLPYDEKLGIASPRTTPSSTNRVDVKGTPPEKSPLADAQPSADLVPPSGVQAGGRAARLRSRRFGPGRSGGEAAQLRLLRSDHRARLDSVAVDFGILAAELGYADKAQRVLQRKPAHRPRRPACEHQPRRAHGRDGRKLARPRLGLRRPARARQRAAFRSDSAARLARLPLRPRLAGPQTRHRGRGKRRDPTPCATAPRSTSSMATHVSLSSRAKHKPSRSASMLLPNPQSRIPNPRSYNALIFDLDGVLADTAMLHHAAWKRLAGELGLRMGRCDRRAAQRRRPHGLARYRAWRCGEKLYELTQKHELAERKNGYYRKAIESFSANDLLPGALDALKAARAAGLKIALASASRSAEELVERMGVAGLFDHIVDSATIARAKPDPEIFLRAAAALDVDLCQLPRYRGRAGRRRRDQGRRHDRARHRRCARTHRCRCGAARSDRIRSGEIRCEKTRGNAVCKNLTAADPQRRIRGPTVTTKHIHILEENP